MKNENTTIKNITRPTRLAKNAKILKSIVNAIWEKKGEQVVSLDLRKIEEAVADFFIVCEATSTTQVRAIADHIDEKIKEECGEYPFKVTGTQQAQWVVMDYVNVVVHIMLPDTRKYYRIEELWADAEMLAHQEA